MSQRDTTRYILKDGNTIKYFGITNNPARRLKEHSKDKEFSKMEIVGPKVKRESAEKWETQRIAVYLKNHKGTKPPLNKTSNGK